MECGLGPVRRRRDAVTDRQAGEWCTIPSCRRAARSAPSPAVCVSNRAGGLAPAPGGPAWTATAVVTVCPSVARAPYRRWPGCRQVRRIWRSARRRVRCGGSATVSCAVMAYERLVATVRSPQFWQISDVAPAAETAATAGATPGWPKKPCRRCESAAARGPGAGTDLNKPWREPQGRRYPTACRRRRTSWSPASPEPGSRRCRK